jgi:hypothetical protein
MMMTWFAYDPTEKDADELSDEELDNVSGAGDPATGQKKP